MRDGRAETKLLLSEKFPSKLRLRPPGESGTRLYLPSGLGWSSEREVDHPRSPVGAWNPSNVRCILPDGCTRLQLAPGLAAAEAQGSRP